jgi:hypothetical protein
MKIALTVPVSHARVMVKTFNILAQLYAKTFDIPISLHKSGLRLRSDGGFFDMMPQLSEGVLELHVVFSNPTAISKRDQGIAGTFLACFKIATEAASPTITYNPARSDFHYAAPIEAWGRWALLRLHNKFPDQALQVIPATLVAELMAEAAKKPSP